jgi:hypothetical protein
MRAQHGYERIELVDSLAGEQTIDAYCLTCDVLWPISADERSLLATLIAREPVRDLPTGGKFESANGPLLFVRRSYR